MTKLTKFQKTKMLTAIELAVIEYPHAWNVKGYRLLKAAIRKGELIQHPEKLGIGHPVTAEGVGFEYVYILKGYDTNDKVKLAVQIDKKTAYTKEIGYSAYKI